MDTRDGRIMPMDQVAALSDANRAFVREMKLHPTPDQLATGRVGRNDPCPCGSGKKFKVCCLSAVGSGMKAMPAPAPSRWGPSPVEAMLPALTAASVLEAVEGMDAGQLAELKRMLGIASPHPLLILPGPDGRPVEPGHSTS
jgi:hypothetical protein